MNDFEINDNEEAQYGHLAQTSETQTSEPVQVQSVTQEIQPVAPAPKKKRNYTPKTLAKLQERANEIKGILMENNKDTPAPVVVTQPPPPVRSPASTNVNVPTPIKVETNKNQENEDRGRAAHASEFDILAKRVLAKLEKKKIEKKLIKKLQEEESDSDSDSDSDSSESSTPPPPKPSRRAKKQVRSPVSVPTPPTYIPPAFMYNII